MKSLLIMSRHFLNNLASSLIAAIDNSIYLEIGVFYGSTLFSVLKDNPIHVVAVDCWTADTKLAKSIFGDLNDAKSVVMDTLNRMAGNVCMSVVEQTVWIYTIVVMIVDKCQVERIVGYFTHSLKLSLTL